MNIDSVGIKKRQAVLYSLSFFYCRNEATCNLLFLFFLYFAVVCVNCMFVSVL
nr:MAG TPA: hypothetical protein [Caudoviricetes sp.]